MTELKHKEIAEMKWETFEELLQPAARGAKRDTSKDKAMREYFGREEFEYLQKLAAHTRQIRSRAPVLGNVVLLPGIMGSDLSTLDKSGDEDVIWINYVRLVLGQIKRLKLGPDGSQEADPGLKINPKSINKRFYARAVLWLRARWNVEPFAFDWRKDINVSSDALARFIREKFGGKPVNLVAHSMGGLVSRNFIRLHRELWDKMRGDNGGRGGRLIMLGTPNYGSFVIPQTLTGVEKLVRWLEIADLNHNIKELLEIINTFVGLYQMLPAPTKIPASIQAIYRKDSWGKFPVSERHFNRTMQFHFDLENEQTIDPERMIYIAGCNRETLSGLKLVAPGEFDYEVTYDGDGRVPHELGLLKDVPTYYIEETHADLARNEKVLTAIDELLERGRTSVLSTRTVAARTVPIGGKRWRRPIGEEQIGIELETIAERANKNQAQPEELRIAEETIMAAVLGQDKPAKRPPLLEEKKKRPEKKERPKLRIDVVLGDITQVQAPVVVVGHYKGVAPVRAIGAIDEAIDFWISRAAERGMIGADLGEVFFIPITQNQIAAKAVLIAGMGEAGKFTRDDLRYLMANVTYAISALGLERFASVLIGSGEGNMSKENALRETLEGISDGLNRLPESSLKRLKQLILVEINKDYHKEMLGALNKFKKNKTIPNLDLAINKRKLPSQKRKRRHVKERVRPQDLPSQPLPGVQITIERDGDKFRFSALSNTAVVSIREVDVQSFFANGASERLMTARTGEEQEKYGQLLYTYLIPEDFRQVITDNDSLTIILDRSTASFPWEMAGFKKPRGINFFGPDLKLTRQFRTLLSSAPGIIPPLSHDLKVLVIADPAPEAELQLPGARQEGREVVKVLNDFKKNTELTIEITDRIGPAECDPLEILALIFNEEFDIVHFAGHGIFDEKNPHHGGWIFGTDCILSPREIFRARRVPRLVFANACFSAVVREGKAISADEMNRQLAGLAEAFFERGVQNYIGAGWPVEDIPAVEFARVFYEKALTGETLGDALSEARRSILYDGSTWGAYQHYGQVNAKLVIK
jgi:pimeloyl-ACP methyl ester carboxylesterase